MATDPMHMEQIYYSNMQDFLMLISYRLDKARVEESIRKKQQEEQNRKYK